jgi:hypothetical protein
MVMTNLKSRVGGHKQWIRYDRDQWRKLENTIMNFLTSLATVSFSRSLLYGVRGQ